MHNYNDKVARYYAAYRPPLHQLILAEVLSRQSFECGLDIGCGTGRSAVALKHYCERVIAIDPSQQMLEEAINSEGIEFGLGEAAQVPAPDASIDVVTLAGVLPYTNTPDLIGELQRISRKEMPIVVYDFEVHLDELVKIFSINLDDAADYDHALNLCDHDTIATSKVTSRTIELSISNQQAMHIILSDEARLRKLETELGALDPMQQVIERLERTNWSGKLSASIYYACHFVKQ